MKEYNLYDNKLLLELLSKSDKLAFTEIYNRFWQRLFAIAYNRIKEIELAEDIVHDVLASLWANREQSKIIVLENYLASATKYMVLDKITKKKRERNYNNSLHPTPVIEFPIEASLHYKRILEFVKKEIDNLPEKCKLIFKYSRNEEMPIKQIAKELNLSTKTVENQINKALKHLKTVARTILHTSILLLTINTQ